MSITQSADFVLRRRIEFLEMIDQTRVWLKCGKHTRLGNTNRSCNIHVLASVAFISLSSVTRLISAVASRSLIKAVSISMCELGQSDAGVYLSNSANNNGYLQILWMGCSKRRQRWLNWDWTLTYLDKQIAYREAFLVLVTRMFIRLHAEPQDL